MRIVILADSLARARPDLPAKDRTRYEDVYGYLIERRYWCRHEVVLSYVESLDSQDGVHWSQRMVAYREPDVVIYQLGINDCAPRVFRKESRSIFLRPWFIKLTRNIVLRLVHRFRGVLTRIRRLVYVKPADFERNFLEMMAEVRRYSPAARFYAVSIGEVPASMNERSYRYNENVREYINGYTCVNDVTARGLQKQDDQWTRAKGFDTFCAFGPWIDTEFNIADALITSKVNGQPRQMASTRDMLFSVATLVAYISSVMPIEPGDLVFTGTPPGVGPLVDGNEVVVEIEGLGVLRNPVKAEG